MSTRTRPPRLYARMAAALYAVALLSCGGDSLTPPVDPATEGLGTGLGDEQFARIPAGTFRMGDITGNGHDNERPVHTVNITRDFYLQKTEVTQAQWDSVMGSNPSYFVGCGETCPVERVSWDEIQELIRRLNVANPDRAYRLPTEAEWEYAARAGATGDYGGTGTLAEMGWYDANAGDTTHPVARKAANAWGLFDMHGNVREWVQDRYDQEYYTYGPTDDPEGPASGLYRVLRGGSWHFGADNARSAFRIWSYRATRYYAVGFRLARSS